MEDLGTRLWKIWQQGYGRSGNEATVGQGTRLQWSGNEAMEGLGTRLGKVWERGYGRSGNEAREGQGTRLGKVRERG